MTSQSCENHASAILVYGRSSKAMVLCAVIGCSKCSGRNKDVSFYRIPKVIAHRGKQEYELTKKRRAGFLAAISRALTSSRTTEFAPDTSCLASRCMCMTRPIQTGYQRYILDIRKSNRTSKVLRDGRESKRENEV